MKKIIFICIVAIQLILILEIGIHIIQKKKQVLGMVSVINSLKNEIIISSLSSELKYCSELKYFYEPKANLNYNYKDDTDRNDVKTRLNQGVYTINSDTFNARRDYSVQKPDNTFRIIALGDSFTFGKYVNNKDNWPSVLEDKLGSMNCNNGKRFEVINLGVGGYDSRYEVERFKRKGIKYAPDLVIWLHVDLSRVKELLVPFDEQYNNINKKEKNMAVVNSESFLIKKTADFNKLYDYSKRIQYNKDAIESMSNYYNGELLLIPMPFLIKNHEKQILRDIASKKSNWIYFDGLRNIYNLNGHISSDFHPNQKGHKMIAEDIFTYLTTNKLVPCN